MKRKPYIAKLSMYKRKGGWFFNRWNAKTGKQLKSKVIKGSRTKAIKQMRKKHVVKIFRPRIVIWKRR